MTEDVIYLRNGRFPDGAFIPRSDGWISPDDRGFVFADGVYEVIRSYGGRLFELSGHLRRLERSLRGARLEAPDRHALVEVMKELLARNGLSQGDAMVYLQITRGEARRAHPFPVPAAPSTIYMAVSPPPDYAGAQQDGVSVITLSDFRWSRCDIKTIALQANVLALQCARDRGADECLFVRDGVFTEGTHTNFFGVVDGVIHTHPISNHVLAGITRDCVIDICCDEGYELLDVPIAEMDAGRLEEAFLTATSYEVTPIVAINGVPVGDGKPGMRTVALQRLFRTRTRSKPL